MTFIQDNATWDPNAVKHLKCKRSVKENAETRCPFFISIPIEISSSEYQQDCIIEIFSMQ